MLRGLASGVVALLLPHFLTRWLDHARFEVWVLLLQVAAFGTYLDSGVQVTIARFFAQAREREEVTGQEQVVSTGLALLTLAGLVSLALVTLEIVATPWLFPQLPRALVREFRFSLFLIAGTAAAALPLSAYAGVLTGSHRNELLALSVGGSRIVGALAVLLVASHTHSLITLSTCIVVPNLLGSVAYVLFTYRIHPSMQVHLSKVSRRLGNQLLRFGAGLMIWSFAGILVSGMDLTVLGHFDFEAVGFYSVSAYLVSFLAGVNASIGGALMSPIAALHASGARDQIRVVTIRVTRASTYANLILLILALLWGNKLLQVWVGPTYAGPGSQILYALMIANVIRLIPGVYASMLIATGQQKQGIAQGIAEGVTNLAASLLLVVRYGAAGVAMGTLLGALVGVGWTWVYTLQRATEIPFPRQALIVEGAMRPAACLLPLLLLHPVLSFLNGSASVALACVTATVASVWLVVRYGHLFQVAKETNTLKPVELTKADC